MKPEAFLPSNSPGLGSAAVVPPTPVDAGPIAGARPAAPKPGPTLAQYYKWAGEVLRDNRNAPREYRLKLINWRHQYQLEQEADRLQRNPAAAEELRVAAERLARKAQSGFAPGTPPSDLVAAIKDASL